MEVEGIGDIYNIVCPAIQPSSRTFTILCVQSSRTPSFAWKVIEFSAANDGGKLEACGMAATPKLFCLVVESFHSFV